MSIISAQNLHKRYGSQLALDGFNLKIDAHNIVGLIGPNGAGKTTLLRAIMGLNEVQGELKVLGLNPYSQRHLLMNRSAYIADVDTLPRWMKVKDLIRYVTRVHAQFDKEKVKNILSKTSIKQDAKIKTLSKGMVTQLHLAIVCSLNTELLVLDEPTLGLDIIHRQAFYDRLQDDFHKGNKTILISTHEVSEIEHLLTHVVFIAAGQSILCTAMEEVTKRFYKVMVNDSRLEKALKLSPISQRSTPKAHQLIFENANPEQLSEIGELSTPNLAELFVAYMRDIQ